MKYCVSDTRDIEINNIWFLTSLEPTNIYGIIGHLFCVLLDMLHIYYLIQLFSEVGGIIFVLWKEKNAQGY